MEPDIRTQELKIKGMSCVNCENAIERKLKNTTGIKKVKASYNKELCIVTYDADVISIKDIISLIEALHYKVEKDLRESDTVKIAGISVLLLALFLLFRMSGISYVFNLFPEAKEGMGYGVLFVIGVLTSLHCVAMCGGINLSQCISKVGGHGTSGREVKDWALRPSFLYNAGRVVSYTVLGGIVGLLGSAVSFSSEIKGLVQLLAGVFMVIMGLNMLNVFPWLRKLNPRMPKLFANKINSNKNSNSPFYVGLLNGLMPCGPLQAMQLYALSTGSPVKGALSMLLFSLGTVPLMFGLGALSSFLSGKFTKKAMTAGAVLVMVLGVSMFNTGLSLSGYDVLRLPSAEAGEQKNLPKIEDGKQVVTTTLNPGRYEPITVQAGIPVVWTIEAGDGSINGCNNRIFIPEYGIEKKFQTGDNVIEFTPEEAGTYGYSCWMGMIRSTITVLSEEIS